jgi:hypothetical protein
MLALTQIKDIHNVKKKLTYQIEHLDGNIHRLYTMSRCHHPYSEPKYF